MAVNKIKCYTYWYTMGPNERTEYVNVFAATRKQSWFFFCRFLYDYIGHWYDYDIMPAYVTDEADFVTKHYIGEISGGNAII